MEDYLALLKWAENANLDGISEDEIRNSIVLTDTIGRVR